MLVADCKLSAASGPEGSVFLRRVSVCRCVVVSSHGTSSASRVFPWALAEAAWIKRTSLIGDGGGSPRTPPDDDTPCQNGRLDDVGGERRSRGRSRGPGMAGTAEAAEAADTGVSGRVQWGALHHLQSDIHPRSNNAPRFKPSSCIPPAISCIHIHPRRQALPPLSASPRPMAGGPQGESRSCVGQLTKLNENKMANRCAMRQRPNPKREVPSQPTPCQIFRVLLLVPALACRSCS